MKVEDLMIGDWVCLADGNLPLEERYFKIEYLATSSGVSWTNQGTNAPIGLGDGESLIPVFTDEIYPIPLTTEILEKNGFKTEFYSDYKVYELNNFKVCKSYCDYFEACDLWKDSDFGWEIISFCPCIYVHELQHALKLCGIDKEIII